ncbi:competence/damage-inducible protein A [Desulfuribacillus alkaliarsenatis]|uniref:Putative competence-damage inducible protein n=1 Tax=Desulfuribacillus alkaliarsenatis TaxID=766136 RepID=A0A1E5G6F1_9FIRM|nr:competence/damage-inducible protein A [Desulfuribacillus alkaliarsenatis]OEF98675.1 competence/damage-inducible protein A [Desulfuribacillus alkaliarsenatis]
MKTEIIAVGTELLLGQITNTNAQYLSRKLAEYGFDVYYHSVVGDNSERLTDALEIASARSQLIILTGGLGPTDDDLTKETLASYVRQPLVIHGQSLEQIKQFFLMRKKQMPATNTKQALIIEGSIPLYNNLGTAPGLLYEHSDRLYALLPGPPRELKSMFEHELLPNLLRSTFYKQTATIYSHVLRFLGIGESALVEKIDDLLKEQSNPTIAPLCSEMEVTLRITAKAVNLEKAKELIEPIKQEITQRLAEYYYADNDKTLLDVLHTKLLQYKRTIAIAESCTGGLLSSFMTSLPDSSKYFIQGIVCYSNKAKQQLGITSEMLKEHGAVSSPVTEGLAELIRKKSQADYGISITGLAGPAGAEAEKPIGLVYISVSSGNTIVTEKHLFNGDRETIRMRAIKAAQYLLLKQLEEKVR